jgi:hypothetical protein
VWPQESCAADLSDRQWPRPDGPSLARYDEYETPIELGQLARELGAAIEGRVIVLSTINAPALCAGTLSSANDRSSDVGPGNVLYWRTKLSRTRHVQRFILPT